MQSLRLAVAFISSTAFASMFIHICFWSMLINFLRLMNRRLGPGMLLKLIIGQYHRPVEEKRIFMFLDLTGATPIAEKMGNLCFSRLLQDCFRDLSPLVLKYKAEVYQYVGDEVVLSWDLKHGLNNNNCL